ncbi:asparagine--tRNA ligase, cytoplasmic 2 [Cynara cardunculus var. scolymus]|uniref:asparagine--tRNA ligase, cytoplasmic 2 n=1 Tax=Cynara cardunculus var. scolymus TaxID=59895 RepID=UPI000D630FE9|nr:asparagine--tRNA ligase, cytoplasmic 2 [Cynara cardunculus var. scolymus]
MASDHQPFDQMPVVLSKYSKRVLLKTILDRADGGLGLVEQRVVVGGWVKSSREMRKNPPPPPTTTQPPVGGGGGDAKEDAGGKDVKCVEVFQSRIPFLRTIIKVFGGNTAHTKEKLESIVPKPQPPMISFLQISDGSSVTSLQIMVDSSIAPPSLLMPTGTCILAEGILQKSSLQGKRIMELKAEKLLHIGIVDQDRYPLSKKSLPLASLRHCAHFRPRTTTVASIMRVRNVLTQASHAFFQNQGFVHVEVPILTAMDTDGFSEKFQVSTSSVSAKEPKREEPVSMDDTANVSLETIKLSIVEKSKKVEELKRSDSNKEALAAAVHDLQKTNALAAELEARSKSKSKPKPKSKSKSKSSEFFSNEAFLASSGTLHLESCASALGNVYAFGPRFQADKSESKKSLAESWMIETEIAFSELEDVMSCAEDFLKFVFDYASENCYENLYFLSKRVDKTIIDRLRSMASTPFEKISYTTAVEVLDKVVDKTFETKIRWGVALTEEHESYLVNEFYKKPVIIYDHPKELKPFHVRLNDDGKTVAAFDVIVPKVGVLIQGSQKEERSNHLSNRINELGLQKEQYEWYLDLRKQGTVKHSGFSVTFDVMVLFATGLNDIQDAVPFPRNHGKLHN